MRLRPPPRFAVRTLIVTLVTVGFVLTAVLLAVTLNVRQRVRDGVAEKLETGQRLLAALEDRRADELRAQAATLAENPTLKAALDTYQSELSSSTLAARQQLLSTIVNELEKLSLRIDPDALAVRNGAGAVLAVAGRHSHEWRGDSRLRDLQLRPDVHFVSARAGVFRIAAVPITLQGTVLGTLEIAFALDERYAVEITKLSGAQAVIVSGDAVIGGTLPVQHALALTPQVIRAMSATQTLRLAGAEFAVRQLLKEGDAAVYVFESIDAAAGPAIREALGGMGLIALGAFLLACMASLWLARTISQPVDRLSRSLSEMARTHNYDHPLPTTRESLEVDTLTTTFNTMMQSVKAAEEETLNAYLGAIRALALALDARDPYTAGHSERVSALSLGIGRQMRLDDEQLDVLRLGALLHDIGKIGISDDVLRKAGPLTPREFEIIKEHPGVGARILRSVRFLEPHIPIVELHHERPDGRGYPHGLKGTEIPLLARIVHVADALDAMTSARAYRPARDTAEGLRELWRCSGTEYDAEVVQALAIALPDMDLSAASPSLLGVPSTRSRVQDFGASRG